MIFGRMFLMLVIAGLSGFVWWTLNIVVGNLTVVDHYIQGDTPQWWAAATFSVMLSVGLFALQILREFEQSYKEADLPIPRSTLILFGVLTTLVDIPMPAYGVWLAQGWTADLFHGILAFVIGGVIGSVVSQMVMTAALLDVARCVDKMWNVASVPSRKVIKQVDASLPVRPQRAEQYRGTVGDDSPKRRNAPPPPPPIGDGDIAFMKAE